jgi:hypothetical protein
LGLWYLHDGADDAGSLLGYVALQFGEVAFKDGALRLNFSREQPFEIVNETAELIDLHLREGLRNSLRGPNALRLIL